MTVSLWRAFLVLLLLRRSIVAGVNSILGTDCKGAVGKKGDKFFCGYRWTSIGDECCIMLDDRSICPFFHWQTCLVFVTFTANWEALLFVRIKDIDCLPLSDVNFLPPSVWREVEELSELLLRHFSDILFLWTIFKVNEAQILTFSA